MPIYEYTCTKCSHQEDIIQKMSDPVITQCPSCNNDTFQKMISAPSFRLKGTGWYATDFKDKKSSEQKKSTDSKPSASEGKSTGDSQSASA